jgi:phosphoglucomutase
MNNVEANYLEWLNHKNLDAKSKEQLENMTEEELYDAFYTEAEFGTAGIRGIIRPGTNAINLYQIRKANTAFSMYLCKFTNAKETGVAVAYDNRHMSKEFAEECAKVFYKFGIKTYLYKELRSTPQLSYTVRKLGLSGGVVITASHNPKEYNGYKVYDETGCQLTPEKVKEVINFSKEIKTGLDLEVCELSEVIDSGMLVYLDEDLDNQYVRDLIDIKLDNSESNIKALFSGQHGASTYIARKMFKAANYDVDFLEEQCNPDPNFSNTESPNPEDAKAYSKLIEKAAGNYDLLLTTDPDGDRLGIAVLHDGEYKLMSGNQTGAVLIKYILSQLEEKNRLPENGVIFNTIVTSDLGDLIANSFGVEVEKTLTGFKFIGDKIEKYNNSGEKKFLFGYEESYGYLINDMVRDKDALQSLLIIFEAANFYKKSGKTIYDVLLDIYDEHGTFIEVTESIKLEGESGQIKIDKVIEDLQYADVEERMGTSIKKVQNFITLKEYVKEGPLVINDLDLPSTKAFKIFIDNS